VLRRHAKICNYLDIPLQHISDNVLRAMRRGLTRDRTEALLKRIRDEMPGIALRTTMLVGHPGETEADFETLMDFVAETKFERLGVFTYSHEEGTHAHQLPDDVPEDVKAQRRDDLMALQQDISFALNRERIGQTYQTVIDRLEGGYYVGRTEYDSPEVDNEVLVAATRPLAVGEYYAVRITDALEFDLFGEVVV